MKGLALGFLSVFFLATARANDSIQLPSGTVVKTTSFAFHAQWKQVFPPDQPFFAEKYTEGNLKAIHSRYSGRLDGASVTLHEDGTLKTFMNFPGGHCQGPFRVWDEDNHMLLYSKCQDDKKHGVTCLFKDGTPWLVQEWDKGELQSESVIVRKGSDFVTVDDVEQLAKAKKRLSAAEKELSGTIHDVKASVREWFAGEQDRMNKEKGKALTKEADAQHKANLQRIRKEKDARAAAAHTHRGGWKDRTGRVAAADKKVSEQDEKAANKNAKAVTGEAKRELTQMDKDITEHYKQLYQFALAALEKIPPDAHTSATKAPTEPATAPK